METVEITAGDGGWVLYKNGDLRAYLKFVLDEGRLRPVELRVPAGVPIAEATRRLRPARIEAWVNAPGQTRDHLVRGIDIEVPEWEPPVGRSRRRHSVPQEHLRRLRPEEALPELPTGHRFPDKFYEQLVRVYLQRARDTHAPAATIAEDYDVPITTVHNWIREARRRGFLPPARPGKVT